MFGVQKLQAAASTAAALRLTCMSGHRHHCTSKVHPLFPTNMMLISDTTRSFERLISSRQRIPSGETMNQPVVYKYEHLREADEIRLLHLHRGKSGDPLRADLETVRIRESRYYKAISYTWADESGDTTKCCSLEIGSPGSLLPITRSCDSVLRQVRNHTSWIWIDAVCINQEDVQERGKQVDLMPQIYKCASQTFAYVGEASEDSGLILRNLAKGIWTPPHLLDPFFARPYFSRVWVVQEVALSKRMIMICGDTAVQWTEFMTHGLLQQIYTSSYSETFPTILRLDERHIAGSTTLLDALLLGRSCKASDPRDKIFGLLGLVSTTDRPPANYSMSTAEVYTQIAMYLLKVQKLGLDLILGNLCHRSDEARAQTGHLPSWVPDWSQCEPTFSQRGLQVSGFLRDQNPIFEYKGNKGLFLEGHIVGTLKTLEEHANVIHIFMHLSNSRSRTSRKLPPAYRDKRVYVFSPMSRRNFDLQWSDIENRTNEEPTQTNEYAELAFLFARSVGSEAATTDLSTRQEGDSQETWGELRGTEKGCRPLAAGYATLRKIANLFRDGGDGANNFELLGLVQIHSSLTLIEIAFRANLDEVRYQSTYTKKHCTIRIV